MAMMVVMDCDGGVDGADNDDNVTMMTTNTTMTTATAKRFPRQMHPTKQ